MRNEKMITVSEYTDEIYEELGYYKPDIISAQEYAREVQAQTVAQQQQTTLITVQEYMQALYEVGYSKSEEELEQKIQEHLAKKYSKSERNAQTVERLLA